MGTIERQNDGHYRRHIQEELETEFVEAAVRSVDAGESWETFLSKNAQFSLTGAGRWHSAYMQMTDRRKKSRIGEWSLQSELQLAHDERMRKRQAEIDEKWYAENREDLLKLATEHASWSETKRRLSLTDVSEKDFRRAQREAGILPSSERPDPMEQAFADGFFS